MIVESINTLGYAVGGPNVASTVSAMTDTSKVYVYTGSETGYTAGNWYYYNGSAWVSGGVYQAAAVETDTTLTMPGKPADAKATGDAVADLKSAITQQNIETDSLLNTTKLNPYSTAEGTRITSDGIVSDTSYTMYSYYPVNAYEEYYIYVDSDSGISLMFVNAASATNLNARIETYTGNINGIYSVPEGAVAIYVSTNGNSFIKKVDNATNEVIYIVNTAFDRVYQPFKVESGKYVKFNGMITNNDSTKAVWYSVNVGEKIELSNITTSGNYAVCAYDASGTFVELIANKKGICVQFTVGNTVSMVACTALNADTPTCRVLEKATLSKSSVQGFGINQIPDIVLDKTKFTSGGYINSSDSITLDADYSYSNYIEVVENANIEIANFVGVANICVTYYNATKEKISIESASSGSTITSKTIKTPISCKYIRYSILATQIDTNTCKYIRNHYDIELTNSIVQSWYDHSPIQLVTPFSSLSPVCTFIDDDTVSLASTKAFRDACVSKGIVGTFACVTHYLDDVNGLEAQLLDYEKEGFQITLHASGHGTYFRPNTRVESDVEEDVVVGIRRLLEAGFNPQNIRQWVTPYGVSDAFIQNIARKHGFDCLISAGNREIEVGKYGRYKLMRPEIKYGVNTLDTLKAYIDEAIEVNGWVAFCSHFGYTDWESSGSKDLWDSVVDYALSKQIKITTYADAWRLRRPIYRLRDYFS